MCLTTDHHNTTVTWALSCFLPHPDFLLNINRILFSDWAGVWNIYVYIYMYCWKVTCIRCTVTIVCTHPPTPLPAAGGGGERGKGCWTSYQIFKKGREGEGAWQDLSFERGNLFSKGEVEGNGGLQFLQKK